MVSSDVYSAVALASIVNQYVMLFEPVCVMGVSSHSNGASSFSISENLKPSETFYAEPNIPFHLKLGSKRIKSINIINYECYLQAEHLHKDFLHVDMKKQLELALSKAVPGYREELWLYCAEVAEKNGISLDRLNAMEGKAKQTMAYLCQRFSVILNNDCQIIDASRYGVENIYDATLLTKNIYQASQASKYLGLSRCARGVKRIVGSIFRKVKLMVMP